jgi:cytoskeletal protein CcmA (bactofilin family)
MPSASPRPASVIAEDTKLEGNVSGVGDLDLQIDGVVRGDVRVSHVIVGAGADVGGGIYAETVEVLGKVVGSITAKQIRLHHGCHIDADISERGALPAMASGRG